MKNRDQLITESKKCLAAGSIRKNMSDDELFQNKTIRPVVDFQQELLIEVFRNYIFKHKNVFYDLSIENKLGYIENAIQKDMKFRNILKGIVIGQFTVEEYLIYTSNSSALNKRMMLIVKECLQERLQLFSLAS